jgi:copper chaperone CopZ
VRGKALLAGSVLNSIAASVCCTGPFLAIILGLGTFGAAIGLEVLRPYLLGLTALLLGVAFYTTYRSSTGKCTDETCAASRASRVVLWSITAVVIAAAASPYYSGAILKAQTGSNKPSANAATSDNEATAVITVGGMTCGSCANYIEGVLTKAPGVKSVEVSFEKSQAVVRYDPKATDPAALRAAIEAIGYTTDEAAASPSSTASDKVNVLPGLPARRLKEEFNLASDAVRVLAILSPTCDACRQGRGILGELFKNQASERLAGFVVWLPMKPEDSPQTARLKSEKIKDGRASVRGWDSDRQIGNLFARTLKLSSTSWDVYLVYAPGIKWEGEQPPKPSYWMHQLQGQRADRMLCLNPAALSAQVERLLAQGSKAAKSQVDSTRVSFYTVPLVCGAAPEIGCGSRAKPILRELERNPAVAEAWLNRPGTEIAVLWAKDSTASKRAEAITAIAKKSDLAIQELSGDKRETALKEFDLKSNWYRSSEVDRLSEEEAGIIAVRLVRRLAARVTLSGEQAVDLRKELANAFKRFIFGAREKSLSSLDEEFLTAGRKHLTEEGVTALKHVLSLGIRPLPEEK